MSNASARRLGPYLRWVAFAAIVPLLSFPARLPALTWVAVAVPPALEVAWRTMMSLASTWTNLVVAAARRTGGAAVCVPGRGANYVARLSPEVCGSLRLVDC